MTISVRNIEPMPTRACKFCLALQDDSVFADFDIDQAGCAVLVRISFDGYGCCRVEGEARIGSMSPEETNEIVVAIKQESLQNQRIESILENYLTINKNALWVDALEDHQLIPKSHT